MSSIIDVRGTHGSGKTTGVLHLLHQHSPDLQPIMGKTLEGKEVQMGTAAGSEIAAVGRYYDDRGIGCDGIPKADDICQFVRQLAALYDKVVLEGILVAHTFKRYNALSKELQKDGHDYVFCFLNTPLEDCIERVKGRRLRAGNHKPFNTTNLELDHHTIWTNVRNHCYEHDCDVAEIQWDGDVAAQLSRQL